MLHANNCFIVLLDFDNFIISFDFLIFNYFDLVMRASSLLAFRCYFELPSINKDFTSLHFTSHALRRNKQIPRQSTLAPLNPVLVNGILRSNTRLQQADNLPYEVKCPIILPKRNQVTGLIVKYYHESEGHQMGGNFVPESVDITPFNPRKR